MTFRVEPGPLLRGSLGYIPSEYSIGFLTEEDEVHRGEPYSREFDSALQVESLQLLASSSDGRVGYPTGYHPRQSWLEGAIEIPDAESGLLFWEPTEDLMRGAAIGLVEVGNARTTHDSEQGWLRIDLGSETPIPQQTIEFCSGAIAGLNAGELVSLWIHLSPDFSERWLRVDDDTTLSPVLHHVFTEAGLCGSGANWRMDFADLTWFVSIAKIPREERPAVELGIHFGSLAPADDRPTKIAQSHVWLTERVFAQGSTLASLDVTQDLDLEFRMGESERVAREREIGELVVAYVRAHSTVEAIRDAYANGELQAALFGRGARSFLV